MSFRINNHFYDDTEYEGFYDGIDDEEDEEEENEND